MTANNQAFVKAFARRNRNADPHSSHQQNPTGVETKSPSPAPAPATWWIDEADDQKVRADHEATTPVPAPHFANDIRVTNQRDEIAAETEDAMQSFPEPESDPIPDANVLASLQHTITSFASESYAGTSDIIGGGFAPFVARELDENVKKTATSTKPQNTAKPATAKVATRTSAPTAEKPIAAAPHVAPPRVNTQPTNPQAGHAKANREASAAKPTSHEASIIELQRLLSSKTAAARTAQQQKPQTETASIQPQSQSAVVTSSPAAVPAAAATTIPKTATAAAVAPVTAAPAIDTTPTAEASEPVETSSRLVDEVAADKVAGDVAVKLKAAWEVDQFDVPSNVAKLFFDGEVFQMVAEQMLSAVQTGLDCVLVTSVHPEEGRSTVATGVAMAAAATGIRVALVDADLVTPTLVDELSLDVEYGWLDALRGGLSLGEIAVHAVEDHVTLFPLFPSEPHAQATAAEIATLIETLKQNYDLVIIDGPLGDTPVARLIAGLVESAMIVRDIENTTNEEINALSAQLRQSGIQGVGVVDNFA
ncbi:division plane positioning ATPase MipZ [Novipirellula caenicola]|uniref:Non-specific protein-tyrosine kinase n=1 Tax=Novipirellula caenicola TaxID=1536901 RepID=A0ABP9VPG8_9BACT